MYIGKLKGPKYLQDQYEIQEKIFAQRRKDLDKQLKYMKYDYIFMIIIAIIGFTPLILCIINFIICLNSKM